MECPAEMTTPAKVTESDTTDGFNKKLDREEGETWACGWGLERAETRIVKSIRLACLANSCHLNISIRKSNAWTPGTFARAGSSFL